MMSPRTQRAVIAGPAGDIECAIDVPAAGAPTALLVVCHPHPQFGGTMDNKVVQTAARTGVLCGWRSVRFNYRGVGGSAGSWDGGRGEIGDALAVIAAERAAEPAPALVLAGFSFGGYVAAAAAERLHADHSPVARLALIAPSTQAQAVPRVPPDTLVIHGEADDVVPLAATLDWARPQALPVVVIPGVGHFFHGQLGQLKRLLLDDWSSLR